MSLTRRRPKGEQLERRLKPINAILDLATPDGINPTVLAEYGYRVAGLEVPVSTTLGNVVIDIVIANGDTGHILAVESKCGGNVEEPQCTRYAALDPVSVVRQARIDLFQRVTPWLDVVYACLGEHEERIRQGLVTAEVDFPILSVHDHMITLNAGTVSERLSEIFSAPVRLAAPPPRLIPFDADSDVVVVEPHVRTALVAALAQRLPEITMATMTDRTIRHFALFGRKAQSALKNKVGEAARRIAESDPQTFRYHGPPPNQDGWVSLLRTPESNDPRGRTQAYQALARSSRFRHGLRRTDIIPGQTDLLEELDKADEGTGDSNSEQPEEMS